MVEKKIGFVGIDVLACFIESGLSMNDDAHMRKLTTPLCAMLERTRATAMVLRHLNKKKMFAACIGVAAVLASSLRVGQHSASPPIPTRRA